MFQTLPLHEAGLTEVVVVVVAETQPFGQHGAEDGSSACPSQLTVEVGTS